MAEDRDEDPVTQPRRADAETPAPSQLLSNGSYSVLVTAAGSGWSRRGPLAVTRWRDDPTRDHWGSWIYLRDVRTGAFWSSGYQPAARNPDRYQVRFSPQSVEIDRHDGGIEARTTIVVAREEDAELRRISLTNTSAETREIEVTSYAEIVLVSPEADRAHPAFFNLFVETWMEDGALFCKRRPRDFSETPLFALHVMAVDGNALGPSEYETDRARFLGRGHTPHRPVVMEGDCHLSNTTGPVLDPIVSWRQRIRLDPGQTARVLFTTAFAETEQAARTLARKYRDVAQLDRESVEPEGVQRFELPVELGQPGAGSRRQQTRPSPATDSRPPPTGLKFFNGTGGFTPDGREYVIVLEKDRWTPAPWINVIANPNFGFLISESGSSCTWAGNSRENRLTPWSNDPVADPPGEVIYLRDEESGALWSPTPLPIRETGSYVCRHGQGYSTFEHSGQGIESTLTVFVPPADPVKIARLELRNVSDTRRRLSATYYAEWVLGVDHIETGPSITTEVDKETGALLARNPSNPNFPGAVAFADIGAGEHQLTSDRLEFLGHYGNHAAPAALTRARLSGRVGSGFDSCAAFRTQLTLDPGESRELVFLLGQAPGRKQAAALIRVYRAPGAAAGAQKEAIERWDRLLGSVQIRTPDAALDLLVNRWLLYQVLSGRFWGRAAFYQASGAFGFRDQLQDVMSTMLADPSLAREHIIRCASRQFIEGDVQHWWHPPLGRGVRTRCSDDRVWLPFAVAQYIETTGDESILDEQAGFLTAPPVPTGHDEMLQQPEVASESATIDEHCRRAIAVSLGVGRHGLPLIGSCDWNDGFNRVGSKGRGESVWMAWFLYTALMRYAPIVEQRRAPALARQYREHAARLKDAVETTSWDGDWYRRAYYDDGTPLGSKPNEECRIDSIAQSWAVLSGAADRARAKKAMASLDRHLVRRKDALILLLEPPFDRGPKDPGYIKGYLPGIRENGGQYTHAAAWVPIAFAALGDGDRVAELLTMLNPIRHTSSAEAIEKYRTEPYVLAGDVYSQPPHTGRGGWTWYTGSAGWMLQASIESLVGLRLRGGHFIVDPCVPRGWPGYEIDFRDGQTAYSIAVENPSRTGRGIQSVELDGHPIEDRAIPRLRDGKAHRVRVVLGS